MHFDAFTDLVQDTENPLILLEGRRSIPEPAACSARRVAALLAGRFPQLRFRSGNATGTDEAFAAGIIETAPERLEIIAPDARHRLRDRHPLVRYDSPESLSAADLAAVQSLTIAASPANHRLIQRYGHGGRAAAQAACLIRDSMKVTRILGHSTPPIAA